MDSDEQQSDGAAGLPPMITTEVVKGGKGRGRWIAAFVALVAVVAGALVLVAQDSDPDADEALADAKDAVDDADSYRFELRQTEHVTVGDPGGAGTDTTTRSVSQGEVAAPDRWRTVVQLPGDVYDQDDSTPFETRRIGDRMYISGGVPASEIGIGPAWSEGPVGDEPDLEDYVSYFEESQGDDEEEDGFSDDPSYQLELLLGAYTLPLSGDPAHIERTIRAATDPEVEEQLADGGLRLRATLPPVPEIAKVADDPLPPLEVTLDLDEHRLPTVVRFEVAVDAASSSVEVRFRDWGAEIPVSPPDEAQIDRTPWIEEELIGRLAPGLLLAPPTVPAGLELESAYTYEGFGDEDGDVDPACRELDLTYGTKQVADIFAQLDDEEPSEEQQAVLDAEPYLDLTLMPASCDEDDTPFDEELGGVAVRNGDEGYVEAKIGDVVITIDYAELTEEQVAAIVRSIRPTTVAELASRIPQYVKDEGSGGYFAAMTGGPAFAGL